MSAINRNKKLILSIILLVTLLVATGYALSAKLNPTGKKVTVIRIGSTAPGHVKFLLNQQKKWLDEEFAKDGIKIEYFPFAGGGQEAATALATGGLDIAFTASAPALRTAASGAEVKLIALSSYGASGGSSIAVRKDSPITSVKDLKGKKVAFLTGTVRHSTITKALKQEGLTLKDIDGLNLAFEASGPALMRGDIDAIVESRTTFTPLMETDAIRIILDGRDHPDWSSPSTISVNSAFLKKHPDIIKRFLKIDLQAARWADANFSETIQILAAATKKKESALLRDYPDKSFHLEPKLTQKSIDALRAEEIFLKEAGLANGMVNYANWVSGTLIDEVYAAQGER
jgi:aliphatic sulfonates family ABC transporter substrate-binding protein